MVEAPQRQSAVGGFASRLVLSCGLVGGNDLGVFPPEAGYLCGVDAGAFDIGVGL